MTIAVHVERLVLEMPALTSAERAALGRALERELARLLAEGGLAAEFRRRSSVPRVRAEAIELSRDGSPVRAGLQIARAVHGSLSAGARR
jgi:hypothetical protein